MHESDATAFFELLSDIWSLKGQALNGGAKAIFFRALRPYPLEAVRSALDAFLRDPGTRGALPMPGDVILRLERADGRPGAEEAWATAARSQDEAATVVWTDETCQAYGICRPILAAGDEVGARMAFREAYGRLVAEARIARRPVHWTVSEGHDAAGRQVAIEAAVSAGLLAAPARKDAPLALPAPRSNALAALTNAAPEAAREALLMLRDRLVRPPVVAESEDARNRLDTERAKFKAAALAAHADIGAKNEDR